MYAARYAADNPHRAAFVMASTGESVSLREFEERSNQLAHLLTSHGLGQGDHYAIFMENNNRYLEACGAGERSGMYYTCINSYLTADELAYIVNNSDSRVLITSAAKFDVASAALRECPNVSLVLVVGGIEDANDDRLRDYASATAEQPVTPIPDERLGTPMLYSSGTTGQPKGIVRPLPSQPPEQELPLFTFLSDLWLYREDMVYLSPAPLYHSAPQAAVGLTLRKGGTVVIMESFDPLEYLRLIERCGAATPTVDFEFGIDKRGLMTEFAAQGRHRVFLPQALGADEFLRVTWHEQSNVFNFSHWDGERCVAATPVRLADMGELATLVVTALADTIGDNDATWGPPAAADRVATDLRLLA